MSVGVTVAGSDAPASQYETMFLRSLIKNLVVYGYSNWRRLTTEDSEEHVYQVPGGEESAVRFDPHELAWIADHRADTKDPKLAKITAEENPFSTIVLAPPLESRPDGYGARAYRDAERIENMLENHSRRDSHNSTPGVFTFVDNDAFQVRPRWWCGTPPSPHTNENKSNSPAPLPREDARTRRGAGVAFQRARY